jgi:hypothetical protein
VTCPECRLECPPSASVCDCGYSFDRRIQTRAVTAEHEQTVLLRSIAKSAKSIKSMLVFLSVLAVLATALALFAHVDSLFLNAGRVQRPGATTGDSH